MSHATLERSATNHNTPRRTARPHLRRAPRTGPETPTDLDQVWKAHHAGDPTARERLILHYAPLVTKIARRTAAAMPPHVELDDMISGGMFGLIDALEKFDPSKQQVFEAYAYGRIRGAIIDEHRATDWAPRTVRAKSTMIHNAARHLEQRLGREPSHAELAAKVDLTPARLTRAIAEITATHIHPLDAPLPGSAGELVAADIVIAPGADPAQAHDDAATSAVLFDCLGHLDDRVKLVLVLHYFEQVPLTDIATRFGVSLSRISQLHHRGLRAMRTAFTAAVAA